jgi:peptidyl-prolyl cis-trans isomerase SurA
VTFRQTTPLFRRSAAALFLALAAVPLSWSGAHAQQVVAVVSGEPITAVDVQRRTRLLQLSGNKSPTPKEVLEELIDEKLKLQVARRYKLDITDKEVNTTFNNIAARTRQSPEKFAEALTAAGVGAEMLKARIKADIAWQQIIRGKFQANFQIGEKDVLDALPVDKKDDTTPGVDYTLRPVLLIVQRGSPEAVFAARRKEAEGLRTQFQSCDDGLRFARGLRDVAVRNPIIRSSADFTAQQREVLAGTPVGKLTPPEVTQQGIELFAVCDKKETHGGDTPFKREARDKIAQERFAAQGKRYLRELRKTAMIEYR